MYLLNEVEDKKNSWVSWLATFQEGEKRLADKEDRSKIAISISNNFHKKKNGKPISTARFETFKRDGEFWVRRLTTEEINILKETGKI